MPHVHIDRVHAPLHTRDVFDPASFPKVVDWVVREARARGAEALAACGHSGLLVAGAAGYLLGIPVLAVRKENDTAKGDNARVNGAVPSHVFGYAFVDDFICSGETFVNLVREIRREIGEHARCRWALLYQPGTSREWVTWYERRRAPSAESGEASQAELVERYR